MAKYKGYDRVVFLDGYAQGWADARATALSGVDPALTIRKPMLRYTDAPGVGYNPGGRAPGMPDHAVDGVPLRIDEPGHKTVTGTELQIANMERVKRKDIGWVPGYAWPLAGRMRIPTAAELVILGPRKPCDGESYCPVQPGCHICGLTREELAILDKAKKGGV